MKRWNRAYEIATGNDSVDLSGADNLGRRETMRRIKHSSRTLVVFGVMLATAVLVAAYPLLAIASDGNPHGV
jgi:hypothetical protein